MEIDITDFYNRGKPIRYSASRMELGDDAGKITWNNAKRSAMQFITDKDRKEVINYFEDFGAWSEEELNAMSTNELNALVIQFIAGDIREMKDLGFSWEEYEVACSDGQVSGRMFRHEDRIYYELGS